MQLKKILISLFVVAVMLSTVVLGVAAATPAYSVDYSVSVSGTENAKGDIVYAPGETVDVVIDVNNNPGIALLEVHLAYDTKVLAPIDADNNGVYDYTTGAFLDEDHVIDFTKAGELVFKSQVKFNPSPIVDENGEIIKSGEIVKISFKVLEGVHVDSSMIKIVPVKTSALTKDYDDIAVNIENATFAVHTINTVAGYAATCTEKGLNDAVACTACDYVVSEATEIPELGHTEKVVPGNAPTCLNPGTTDAIICSVCNEVIKASEPTNLIAHVADGVWIVDKAADHDNKGARHQNCKTCGEVALTEEIPALGCTYEGVVTLPTCTTSGYTTYTCTWEGCGKSYVSNMTPVGPHSYGEPTVVEATCTTTGSETYVCSVCGETYIKVLDIINHAYDDGVVTAPTCTAIGFTTYTCSVCKYELVADYVAKLDHEYTTQVTKEATCTAKGEVTYTCACGDTFTVSTDMVAHKYEAVVTAPTCTKMGFTTNTCSVCKDVVVDTYVDAKGHTYTSSVTKEATCAVKGEVTYTCACGDKYTEATETVAHKYEAVVTAPTCTAAGFTTNTCSVCKDVVVNNYVAKLDHTYTTQVTKDATCTEKGEVTYTCTCGDKFTVATDMVAHDYEAVVTDPTCTKMGYTTNTCKVCGEVVVNAYVDALGHTAAVDAAVEPTYSATGLTEGKHCSVCNEVIDAQHTVAEKSTLWIWLVVIGAVIAVGGAAVAIVFIVKKKKK